MGNNKSAITKSQANVAPMQRVHDLLHRCKEKIQTGMPRHLNATAERMIRVALTTIQKNPGLLECTPSSIAGCIIESAQMGWYPDGITGQAYLIPFRDNRANVVTCQLMPGYRGLMELVRRTGQISIITASVVIQDDEFVFERGTEQKLSHRETGRGSRDEEKNIIAAWAMAKFSANGDCQFDVMWRDAIDRVRTQSRSSKHGPWSTHYAEMAKKTVLRRLCKSLPLSTEAVRAIGYDELVSVGMDQGMSSHVSDVAEEFDNASPAPALTTEDLVPETSAESPLG